MAESIVQVTEGSGKKLHTYQRTIGANAVEDELVIPGEFYLATYTVNPGVVSTATAASHLLQVMAGASLNVRIRRIRIVEATPPAAVSVLEFQIIRLTTAGTGGTVITPRPLDTGDAAAGATAMTLPTVKGTVGVTLWDEAFWAGSAALPQARVWEWTQSPNGKPIIIPAGAANGIAVNNVVNIAACTVTISVEFVETSFL